MKIASNTLMVLVSLRTDSFHPDRCHADPPAPVNLKDDNREAHDERRQQREQRQLS